MEFEEILSHISNSDKRLNARYLYGLSDMNREQLMRFRDIWPTIEVARRQLVTRNLVDLAERSFEVNFDPIFLLAMGDADSDVRAAAIDGLWENEDQALVGPLVHLLRVDESASVRAAAAMALGRFVLLGELEEIDRAPAMLAEQALLETLRDERETLEVRRRAVEGIAYSGEAGVRQIIEAAYYDEDEKMQSSALFAMGRSADPYWIKFLLPELESRNPELRFEAARACGELEASRALDKLIDMAFNDPDREVQQSAAWALGRIGGREARQALEACLESDDEALSEAAGEALDEMELLGEALNIPLFEDSDDDYE
jgi:HEAT repeat protein